MGGRLDVSRGVEVVWAGRVSEWKSSSWPHWDGERSAAGYTGTPVAARCRAMLTATQPGCPSSPWLTMPTRLYWRGGPSSHHPPHHTSIHSSSYLYSWSFCCALAMLAADCAVSACSCTGCGRRMHGERSCCGSRYVPPTSSRSSRLTPSHAVRSSQGSAGRGREGAVRVGSQGSAGRGREGGSAFQVTGRCGGLAGWEGVAHVIHHESPRPTQPTHLHHPSGPPPSNP